MSRRTLPLESPYWVPITEAFEWREQQTDSVDLAVHDFNQKLGAGKLRALVRREDGQSELVARTVWNNDLHIAVLYSRHSHIAVFYRGLRDSPREQWFFIWKPDYVRIFDAPAAAAAAESRSHVATQGQEGEKKPGAPLKHEWIAITMEIAFRGSQMQRRKNGAGAALLKPKGCVRGAGGT